jgi:hypothetical protein
LSVLALFFLSATGSVEALMSMNGFLCDHLFLRNPEPIGLYGGAKRKSNSPQENPLSITISTFTPMNGRQKDKRYLPRSGRNATAVRNQPHKFITKHTRTLVTKNLKTLNSYARRAIEKSMRLNLTPLSLKNIERRASNQV